MKLFLAFHRSIKFDDTFYDNSYTISVLSIYDVKYRDIVLNLIGEERKIYTIGCNEKRGLINAIDERSTFLSYSSVNTNRLNLIE